MTNNTIERILIDAETYPLPVRIAWLLHNDGYTEETFKEFCDQRRHLNDSITNLVMNALRDIDRGFYSRPYLENMPDLAYKELKDGQ